MPDSGSSHGAGAGQNWQCIKEILNQVLPAAPADRERILAERCGGDQALRAEVEDYLRYEERGAAAFSTTVWREAAGCETNATPSRIGNYQVIRKLGHGGMAAVYLAERDDGEYRQSVAIKVASAAAHFLPDLFRHERQILARLNHPHIARLMDGGTTEDGRPYLVMEYVEGEALDKWVAGRRLPLRERLKLFVQVCDAVDYAHRRLVIHRDLKPANILVTPEGVPKLLDFGIAKLLESESDTRHRLTGTAGLLTPEYASPEQIRAQAVTTATDIYSLGVVLYCLVAGQRPYAVETGDALELLRAICEQEPKPPSSVAVSDTRALRGELDAIVLQALRKNPEERYPSVRALADDVTAWLDGRPVTAHAASWWRRSVKYVRRNKVQTLAAVLVFVSILAGSGVSVWYARQAQREGQRAQQRFNQVRRLANSVMFELHDAIQYLPGSTAARKLLVQRALEYLRELETTGAQNDRALQLDLGSAYVRIGDVQGYVHNANLGDTPAAEDSYARARHIALAVLNRYPEDEQAEAILVDADARLGGIRWLHGDVQARVNLGREAAAIRLKRARRRPGSPGLLASAYFADAQNLFMQREWKQSAAAWQRTIDAYGAAVAQEPGNVIHRMDLALSHQQLGWSCWQLGELVQAHREFRVAETIDSSIVRASPEDTSFRLQLATDIEAVARVLVKMNRAGEGLKECDRALAILRQLSSADPNNLEPSAELGNTLLVAALAHDSLGNRSQAVQLARQAAAAFEPMLRRDPEQRLVLAYRRDVLTALGDFLAHKAAAAPTRSSAHADWERAATAYEQAAQISSLVPEWLDVGGGAGVPAPELLARSSECRKHVRQQ